VTRLAIVLAVLAVSLLAPSTAAAARSEFFGIVHGPTLDNRDLSEMMEFGRIRTDRFVLNWGWVQPNRGSFRWSSADRFIGELASHGIRLVPSLWGNPDWVAGTPATPPVGGTASEQAWRSFLQALVTRYGRGGTYWANGYRQRYGAGATPLPIQSWQIWNEPNLKKFFAPSPSPTKYARLVRISRDAIKGKDAKAQIILAGMPSNGDVKAWDFLDALYRVAGIKAYFDAAALHPYAPTLDQFRQGIQRVRAVMRNRNDGATALWLTELAWGSAPPDRFGINKGLEGQKRLLRDSFRLVLEHRSSWNVQRLFWYHWRDPRDAVASCSFCASAGLLRPDRTPKPALYSFLTFTGETVRPRASITAGPSQGSITNDPTPTFRFASNEPGSTFGCRVDARAFKVCSSPHTLGSLSEGSHTFSVRAIDAPGNVSAVVSRSFTVNAQP
jgi:hypothetical protein